MEFYSVDIEMLMSGWNTLYLKYTGFPGLPNLIVILAPKTETTLAKVSESEISDDRKTNVKSLNAVAQYSDLPRQRFQMKSTKRDA
jgi:hypothetical protein